MSHKHIKTDNPKIKAYFEKLERRDRRTEHVFHRIIHNIERVIALITVLGLMGALVLWRMGDGQDSRGGHCALLLVMPAVMTLVCYALQLSARWKKLKL